MRATGRSVCRFISAVSIFLLSGAALADDQVTPQEQELRDRYEKALIANPSRGTAFERLYQSYMDVEGVAAWVERLKTQTAGEASKAAFPLIQGFIHERLGDEKAALAAYGEAVSREPGSHLALAARGRLLWQMRRYADASADLRKAIDAAPPRDELENLLKTLGRVQSAAGEADAARKTWMELVERYPGDAAVVEELAELLVDESQVEPAIEQLTKLREIAEDDYTKLKAAHQIAELRLGQEKFDDATKVYRDLLENLAPDSWLRAETRRRIAEAYRRKGDTDGLVRFYTEWLGAHADDVEIQIALADALRQQGQNEKAQETYEAVLKRAPSRKDARAALAETLLDLGRYADATGHLKTIAEATPHEADGWERLGNVYFEDVGLTEADRKAKAIAAWKNIATQKADDATRAVRAAEVFRAHQCENEALEQYRKAIELAADNTTYYEYLGEYLQQLGRKDEAVATWKRLVEGPRATAVNWQRLAEIFVNFEQHDEALKAIEQGVALAGAGIEGYDLVALRASVLILQEKYDAVPPVLDDLDWRAADATQKREVMDRRVDLCRRAGTLAQEVEKLGSRLKASPGEAKSAANGYELLARLHQAAAQVNEAIVAVEKAIELDAKSPERLTLASELYRQAGNRIAAIETLRKLVALDPRQEGQQLEAITDLAKQQGLLDEAIKAAQRLTELNPEGDRGYTLTSDLQWEAGKPDDSIATLRRGIRAAPKELGLHLALARRLVDLDRLTPALDQFWRAFQTAEDDEKKLTVAREMAQVYYSTGQFDRLVDRLNDWRRDPEYEVTASLALAAAYRMAERPERAEHELLRALSKKPADAHTIEQLLDTAQGEGRIEQAIQYGEKLLTLRPNDPKLLNRMGGLLYEAGRLSEAVLRWRASLQSGAGDDPAGRALELAETLINYDLESEAQQTLLEAAGRFPDDWRIRYRLAMQLKRERQHVRAAKMMDDLLTMRPPKDEEETDGKGGAKGSAKKKQPRRGMPMPDADTPVLLTRWSQIDEVYSGTSQDFVAYGGGNNYGYYGYRYRRYYSGWGGGSGTSRLNYMPQDFDSLRIAALVQRLHLGELENKLPDEIAELGRKAGIDLPADAYVAATKLGHDAPEGTKPEKAAVPETLTARPADSAARLTFLRALLITDLDELAYRAACAFQKDSPGDRDVAALLAIFATAQRRGESWTPPMQYYGRSRYAYNPYGQQNWQGAGVHRPASLKPGDFDIQPVLALFEGADPATARALALRWADELADRNQYDDAAKWAGWALERKPPLMTQLEALNVLVKAERIADVVERLPAIRKQIRDEVIQRDSSRSQLLAAQSGQSWSPFGYGGYFNPYAYAYQYSYGGMYGGGWGGYGQQQMVAGSLQSVAEELYKKDQKPAALDLVLDWLDLTRPEGKTGLSGQYYRPAFALEASDEVEYPTPDAIFPDERLTTYREWFGKLKKDNLLDDVHKRLEERFGKAQDDDRIDATMALVIFEALTEKLDAAQERLTTAVRSLDDDRMRLSLAALCLHRDKAADAIEPLTAVKLRTGPIFKDAQIGLLRIAVKLENPELGRRAVHQLLGMRLQDEERFELIPWAKKLGLDQQAAQLQMASSGSRSRYGYYGYGMGGGGRARSARFSGMSAGAGRQMEQLMRLATGGAEKKDAVVALARRIIADKTGSMALNANDPEVRGATRALKQAGALEDEIKRLEGDAAANPNSTDALLPLYLYYMTQNETDKAQAALDRAFALLPGAMQLRYQHAVSLMNSDKQSEAVPYLDRVLTEAPWVIEDGGMLANAYREAGRLNELVETLLKVEPARRLSVERKSYDLGWLSGVASTIEDQQPEMALKLWRRQREMAETPEARLETTHVILGQLCKKREADEFVSEFARLLPEPLAGGETDEKVRRDRIRGVSVRLFQPAERGRDDPNIIMMGDVRPREFGSPLSQYALMLKDKNKLEALDALIAKGAADALWNECIGRGARAVVGLAKEPRDLAPAEELTKHFEALKDESTRDAKLWRIPVQQGFAEALAADERLLPLAARLAADLLPRLDEREFGFRERLALLAIQARAELAAGGKEKARELFKRICDAEDPQYASYRTVKSGNSWYLWQELHQKLSFLELMLDKGFADLALDALFAAVDKMGTNDRWMAQQAEELIGRWLAKPATKDALNAHIEKLEKQLTEKPDDTALANRLVSYLRAADRKEDAEKLLSKALGDTSKVTGQQAIQLAGELFRAGKRDEARTLLLKQVQDGFHDVANMLQQFTYWFPMPEQAELLAKTLEEMPRESRFIQNGDWWMTNLAQSISYVAGDRTPADELKMREIGLRIRRVADDFARVTQTRYQREATRGQLLSVLQGLIDLNRHEEAFDTVMKAVFAAKETGLPEPTLATLFSGTMYYSGDSETPLLASYLVWLAGKTGKIAELRSAIAARKQQDAVWEDTGLRLSALLELDHGDPAAAEAILKEIAKRPPPPSQEGFDRSLHILAMRIAQRPALRPLAVELLTKVVEQIETGPRQNWEGVTYLFDLARMRLDAGQREEAKTDLGRVRELMPEWYREEIKEGDPGVQAGIADIWLAAGHADEAANALRQTLRRPFQGENNYWMPIQRGQADRKPSSALGPMVVALQRLAKDGKLDAYVQTLRDEWAKTRDKGPGKRDCEPLVTAAACRLLVGDYTSGAALLDELDPAEFPPNLAIVLECIAASPKPADGLDVIAKAFERWPYTFTHVGDRVAKLFLSFDRKLPLGNALAEYIEKLPTPKVDEDNTGAPRIVYPGQNDDVSDPTIAPTPEKQATLTTGTLVGLLNALPRDSADHPEWMRIAEWLVTKLGLTDTAYGWLAALAKEDPAKAYAAGVKLIDLKGEAANDDKAVRLTIEVVFADQQLEAKRRKPHEGEKADPPTVPSQVKTVLKLPYSVAALLVDCAVAGGKLDELIDDCEKAVAKAGEPGSSLKDMGRKQIAARLHLLALAEKGDAKFDELLPQFLKSEERFSLPAQGRNMQARIDVAYLSVLRTCWKHERLRPQAIAICESADQAARRIAENSRRNQGWGRAALRDNAWRFRLAEAQFARGDRDAALKVLEEIFQHYVANLDEYQSGYGGSAVDTGVTQAVQLARKFKAQAEARAIFVKTREGVPNRPRSQRSLQRGDRELRESLKESVEPGIVLAVAPLGENKLQFIWQLNRTVLPDPPELLIDEAFAKIESPLRRSVTVWFEPSEKAVSPEGYDVRIESTRDGLTFDTVATHPAAGTGRAVAGAALAEADAPPGELRWYRARLLEGGRVVATSAAVAGAVGRNLFDAGECRAEPGDAGLAAWQVARYGRGGVGIAEAALPGRGDTALAKSPDRSFVHVETAANVAINPAGTYVLSGWGRYTGKPKLDGAEDEAAEASADQASMDDYAYNEFDGIWWREQPKASATIELNFVDAAASDLRQHPLHLTAGRGTAFTQVVLEPPPERASSPNTRRWLDSFGQGGWSAPLPKKTAAMRIALRIGTDIAVGDLRLIAVGEAKKPDTAARAN